MNESNPEFNPESLISHSAWMKSLAKSLLFDSHRAEDVVQEAWLAAIQKKPGTLQSLRGWLLGTTKNIARNTRRSESNRTQREHQAAQPESGFSEIVERAELHQKVIQTVLSLKEPYRSTILYRFFDGMETEQIAKKMEVPSSTVRTRQQRALEQLRERLDREFGGNRRSWCLALVPIAASAKTLGAASALTGVIAMSTKIKIAAGIFLVLGLGLGWGVFVNSKSVKEEAKTVESPEKPKPKEVFADAALPPEPEQKIFAELLEKTPLRTEVKALAPASLKVESAAASNGQLLCVLRGRVSPPPGEVFEKPPRIVIEVSKDNESKEFEAWADLQGDYSLENLPAGKVVQVEAGAKGFARVTDKPDLLLDPARINRFDIALSRGLTVIGRVINAETKEPVPYAQVWAESWDYNPESEKPTTVADGEGHYQLEGVMLGSFQSDDEGHRFAIFHLYAQAKGFAPPRGKAFGSILRTDGKYEFEIEISPAQCSVDALVYQKENRNPLGSSMVYLIDAQNNLKYKMTDSAGKVRFEDIATGKAAIFAEREAPKVMTASLQIDVHPSENNAVELALSQSREDLVRVEGVVKDVNGRPLAGVPVEALLVFRFNSIAVGGRTWTQTSDAQGVFVFSELPAAFYHFTPRPDSSQTWLLNPGNYELEIAPEKILAPLQFTMEPGAVFAGALIDPAVPLSSLKIQLENELSEEVIQEVSVDSDRRFQFNPIKPGTYRLVVRNGKDKLYDQLVGPNSITGLEILLPETR